MQNHWSSVLDLAEPKGSPPELISSVRATLRDSYGLGDSAAMQRANSGAIDLNGHDVWLELEAREDPGAALGSQLAIRLDSAAYEQAYDAVRQQLHPQGVKALMRLCTEMAGAANAAGFRLRLGTQVHPAFDMTEVIHALTSTDGEPGLMIGLLASSPHWPAVRAYWPRWNSVGAYRVLEFMS